MNNINDYTISEVSKEDIIPIRKIWIISLPNDFFTILGKEFISKIYFKVFFSLNKKKGFKIMKDNEIIGFVLFGRFDDLVKKIIKENFFYLIIYSIKSLFINYKSIFIIANAIIFKILINNYKYLDENKSELLTICIHPNFYGKGFGSKLLNESLTAMRNENFVSEIYVKTQLKSPKFYENCNFKIVKKIFGRIFLVFKI